MTFVLRALRRRKSLFLILFAFVATAVIAGFAVRQEAAGGPALFVSDAQLLVSPPSDRDVPPDAEKMTRWFASEQLFREMIVSEDVLTRVLKASRLDLDLLDLQSSVTVDSPDRDEQLSDAWGNFVVDIQVETDLPEKSKLLADLIVKEAIAYTQELAAREVVASRRQLEKMAQANRRAIEAAERELVEWRKTHDVWDVQQLMEAQGGRIKELQAKKTEGIASLAEETRKLRELESYRNGSLESVPWGSLSLDSQDLGELSGIRSDKKRALAEARAVYQESSASVQHRLAEFHEADSAYQSRRYALLQSAIEEQQLKVEVAQSRLSSTDQTLRGLKGDTKLADSQIELRQLQSDLDTLRENQKDLTTQINEAKVQEEKRRYLAAFTLIRKPRDGKPLVADVTLGAKARAVVSGLFFGLICAGLATVGAEMLSVSLELRPKVEKTLGLPILGSLPKLSKASVGCLSVLEQAPSSFASERFRSIVVNLKRQKVPTGRLLITSCWPGEGKTFVAGNLAVALSRFDARTLLVDGDLRRPCLSDSIGRLDAPGLRQYLEGQLPFEELTVSSQTPNLTILPAGQGQSNPAELLAKDDCKGRLLCLASDRMLIIDSSPLSVCSDSVLMSEAVDGVILVVSAAKWDGKAELAHVLDLEDQGVKVLGVILNGVKDDELRYGAQGYQSGYYSLKRPSDG